MERQLSNVYHIEMYRDGSFRLDTPSKLEKFDKMWDIDIDVDGKLHISNRHYDPNVNTTIRPRGNNFMACLINDETKEVACTLKPKRKLLH